MKLYLDTSLIVSAISNEPRSTSTLAWLGEHGADALLISDWVVTEVSAALSMKVRAGIFTPEMQAASFGIFSRMRTQLFSDAVFSNRFFQVAANMAGQSKAKLRGGDALHIAICAHYADRLCTLDKNQAAGSHHVGVETELLA